MNKKNLPIILVVAIVAGVFSIVLSQVIFATASDKQQKAEIVQEITTEFEQPDKSVFNDKAINPTQLIQIGDSNNSQPL